jgi:hypothetical protein
MGTIRETFFLTAPGGKHVLKAPRLGDFLVDNTYCFEVGGKKKIFRKSRTQRTDSWPLTTRKQDSRKKFPAGFSNFFIEDRAVTPGRWPDRAFGNQV